jgi:MoaA/NifB/PqqE/SkfB family radical SAM enzyme
MENGFLEPALARAVFDDLARVGASFDTLILFWLGEPLIHPAFAEIYQDAVRAASDSGIFSKVELHTNATHLDERAVRVALNDARVPQVWHFSLDAVRPDTYRAIKGFDRYELVAQNIEHFVREKARLGARWPRMVFQLIVSDDNAQEVQAFADHWQQVCSGAGLPCSVVAQNVPDGEEAVVFLRQLDCPTPGEQASQNRVFRETVESMGLTLAREEKTPRRLEAMNLAPCSGFWKSPVIGWNGKVTTCTRDNRFENVVGNVRDQPFSSIWWGPGMLKRRTQVAQGNYEGLPPCGTCFIPRSSNYTDVSPEEIEGHVAWEMGR